MNGLMKPCTTGWCSIIQQSIYPPIQGRLVKPEVVATSPYPIKSRVPVCCGFGSLAEWFDGLADFWIDGENRVALSFNTSHKPLLHHPHSMIGARGPDAAGHWRRSRRHVSA